MIEQSFTAAYDKLRLDFYKRVFSEVKEREGSLSATEMFAVEIINSLGRPTIGQFAEFINISLPGATYKVNSLEKKGYIKRVRSQTDRRESYLEMTEKYHDYAKLNLDNLKRIFLQINERFSPEQIKLLDEMLLVVANEL